MGSGSSREKKISSGLQKEDHMYINNKERNGGDCDPKEEKRLYKSYKIQQLSDFSKSSNRTGLGCHSEGHDSDFSIDDDEDDIEGELDRVLAEYESRDFYSSRKHQNNSFLRSNTYSFCNSRQVYKESDFNSTPYIQKVDQMRTNKQTAFGLFGSKDVQHYDRVQMCEGTVVSPSENNIPVFNNRDTCSQNMQRNDSQKQGKTQDLKNNNLADILHSSSKNPAPVLYDGFEEELMSSIEREYS